MRAFEAAEAEAAAMAEWNEVQRPCRRHERAPLSPLPIMVR